MAGKILIKNTNGNTITLENPDTLFTDKVIDLGTLDAQIGVGQTWQEFTPQVDRSLGVTYTNNTGKPIQVALTGIRTNTTATFDFFVDGVRAIAFNFNQNDIGFLTVIVPKDATYNLNSAGTLTQLNSWSELR